MEVVYPPEIEQKLKNKNKKIKTSKKKKQIMF